MVNQQPTYTVTIRLSIPLYEQLRVYAAKNEITMNQSVVRCIEKQIKELEKDV